jgi:dipeptidyl aminopeptidase/acylaminoacyl peptidase
MMLVLLKPFVPEDLFKMRWVGMPRISPCGRYVVFTLTGILEKENTYTSSVWLYDSTYLDYDPDSLKEISNHGGSNVGRDLNPKWSPDGSKIAFQSMRSGSSQVFVLDMSGGEARQVTQVPAGVSDFQWLGNESLLCISRQMVETSEFREGATARRIKTLRYKFNGKGYLDSLHTELWKVELQDNFHEILISSNHDLGPIVSSPKGTYIAFVSDGTMESTEICKDLYLLELDSGVLTNLTKISDHVQGMVFSPDESALYYVGQGDGDYSPGAYNKIFRVDIPSLEKDIIAGDFPYLIGGKIGSDVGPDSGNTSVMISECGQMLYFVAVNGGVSYLYSLDLESGRWDKVFGEGQMVVKSYDISNGKVVINKATPVTMGDLWYGDLKNSQLKLITGFNSELFFQKYAGWPQPIVFQHSDGTSLEGWIILPNGFKKGNKYPIVMEIHGGPHATYGNVFNHEFQMLAGHGIAVLYTNPRGSMGYGEEFAKAVVGDWCGVDARDLEFMAKEVLNMFDWIDPKRFGVTGGYLTNWLISHTDMFAAAVTQRSMSNLYSKYGVSDIGWSKDRSGMGGKDLWDSEDFIMQRSPIRYAPNVKTPTLIIHSDEDFRCPLDQAEQWYVALKRLGVKTEMLLFHGENHDLSRSGRPANRVVRLEAIIDWFQRFLK